MTPVLAKSYSQYGEDEHILRHFGTRVGRFLDIGAWNATQLSNTRALYEMGWSGVMVEPSPDPFLALLREYAAEPRITLIHAALGFERCCAQFWATADAVSTTERKNYDVWRTAAKFDGSFYVPVLTLPELFNQFGGDFNFVNIDTEGTSVDLFNVMMETQLYPECICVEHDGRMVEVLQIAQDKNYRTLHTNGTNIVLTR